jgi:hypothetical protein
LGENMSGPWEKYKQPVSDGPWANYAQAEQPKPFDYRQFAQEEAVRQGVDPALVLKVIDAESGGRADAVSRVGARGLMQLMPATAKELGVDPNDPQQNITGGIRYLKQQLDEFKTPELALAAYNAGPGTVRKAGNRIPNYPETIAYVQKITGNKVGPTGDAEGFVPEIDASMVKPGQVAQIGKNATGGMIRGAGSIGSTLLAPYDITQDFLAGRGFSLEGNQQRREDIDTGLQDLIGSDPESGMYQAAKLGTEVAGTWGMGNVLARGAQAIPGVPNAFAEALQTGGMRAGNLPFVQSLGARTVGGGLTGLASAGYVDPKNALEGAAIGAVIPGITKVAGEAGRSIGSTISGNISPARAAMARRAAELGIDLPADRIADSKPLNALAASLNYVPFSGRANTERAMYDQTKRALSKTFGQDSENVTQALRSAQDELGGEFNRVLQNNTVKVDDQFLDDLVGIQQGIKDELVGDQEKLLLKQIDNIIEGAGEGGAMNGRYAYNVKKILDRLGDSRDSSVAHLADKLRMSLMSALNRSLSPEEAASFEKVRKMYGNMLDIKKVALNGSDGNISIAKLANMRDVNNPELRELADISTDFLKARENPHGAAQRVFLGGLASGAGLLDPTTLAITGAAMGTGRTANALLNSNAARGAVLRGGGDQPQAVTNALAKYLPLAYQAPQFVSR